MTISRRNFFKLAVGAAAAVAVTPSIIIERVPKIYCDGIHCDAEGLNALIKGDVVEFADPSLASSIGWRGSVLHLDSPRDFSIRAPIRIPSSTPAEEVRGLSVRVIGPTHAAIELESGDCIVSDVFVDGGGYAEVGVHVLPEFYVHVPWA